MASWNEGGRSGSDRYPPRVVCERWCVWVGGQQCVQYYLSADDSLARRPGSMAATGVFKESKESQESKEALFGYGVRASSTLHRQNARGREIPCFLCLLSPLCSPLLMGTTGPPKEPRSAVDRRVQEATFLAGREPVALTSGDPCC